MKIQKSGFVHARRSSASLCLCKLWASADMTSRRMSILQEISVHAVNTVTKITVLVLRFLFLSHSFPLLFKALCIRKYLVKAATSGSLDLERTGCPQKKVCCGGDCMVLRNPVCLSKVSLGFRGGGEGHLHICNHTSVCSAMSAVLSCHSIQCSVFPRASSTFQKLLKSFT